MINKPPPSIHRQRFNGIAASAALLQPRAQLRTRARKMHALMRKAGIDHVIVLSILKVRVLFGTSVGDRTFALKRRAHADAGGDIHALARGTGSPLARTRRAWRRGCSMPCVKPTAWGRRSVSYTHLDVYKRQRQRRPVRPRPAGRGIPVDTGRE